MIGRLTLSIQAAATAIMSLVSAARAMSEAAILVAAQLRSPERRVGLAVLLAVGGSGLLLVAAAIYIMDRVTRHQAQSHTEREP